MAGWKCPIKRSYVRAVARRGARGARGGWGSAQNPGAASPQERFLGAPPPDPELGAPPQTPLGLR
ncbi:MAG: hypothetical protein GY696_38830, partial [Gammaproteobacteria bacterium]|nr:hypothetical protein [Gammaproteobacteria bacterium]